MEIRACAEGQIRFFSRIWQRKFRFSAKKKLKQTNVTHSKPERTWCERVRALEARDSKTSFSCVFGSRMRSRAYMSRIKQIEKICKILWKFAHEQTNTYFLFFREFGRFNHSFSLINAQNLDFNEF